MSKGALRAILLLILVTPVYGQAQPPPTFRLGTELVVVDLVATDRAGRFVPDLQASEIRVLEDGKRQRIEFLRLVRLRPDDTPASSPSIAPSSEPGTPPGDGSGRYIERARMPGTPHKAPCGIILIPLARG